MNYLLNISFIILLTLLVQISAFSQTSVATIIISSGENQVGKGNNFKAILIGSTINSGELLKLSDNGYVALLTKSGRTIELNGAENALFNIDDLEVENTSGRSLLIKYADYVVTQMVSEEREENRKRYASITGAVERDLGISAYMNKTSELYEPFAIIRWNPRTSKSPYSISIQDNFGNQLLLEETNNNYLKINFTNKSLDEVDGVIVSIKDADGLSNEYAIRRVNKNESTSFISDISELKTSLHDDSAFENLILAEFYEQNSLILDASTCFEKAMILEPDVVYFKEAYMEFLMRNKFGEFVN